MTTRRSLEEGHFMEQRSKPCHLAATLIFVFLLWGVVGCGREAPPEQEAPEVAAEETASDDALPPPPPLTAARLAPEIREVGPEDTAPTRIVVRFAEPVVAEAAVGKEPGEGTVLRVEPPVPGALRFTSPSSLAFEPQTGFAPSTDYTVTLEAVATRDGVIAAPAAGRWSRHFTTPSFSFVRLSLERLDLSNKRAEVALHFSAPVTVDTVERFARFSVENLQGERRAPKVNFTPRDTGTVVRARLESSAIQHGGKVAFNLDNGLPSAADSAQTAAGAYAFADLQMGPAMHIRKAYRAEGGNGFYVQVVCEDTAVPGRRGYWDREIREYFRLSPRCVLDEADLDRVHLSPPVALSVTPAGGGFRLFGDFQRGEYTLHIDAGARTADGGTLAEAISLDFSVPARSPRLNFASKGRYLPREAWRSLPVRHLNVDQATLFVRHVPEDNLIYWMSDDDDESATVRTSNLILERPITLGGEADTEATTYVDLASLVPADTRGLLELTLTGDGASTTSRILLTDLHLVAKRAAPEPGGAWSRGVNVWALDIGSVAPVSGVDLRLVRKSGFTVAQCRTGADGGCALRLPEKSIDPSPPFAIVAKRGDDLTYLRFSDLKAEVQEARIAGEPYRSERKYRAAVYGDRGVYRPGETAHFAAIVRGADNLAPEAGMPVEAQLMDPRGREIRRVALRTNGAGYVSLDVGFPAFATTGRYSMGLSVGERQVGQHNFQVEEFVPERMKVEAKGASSSYLLGEEMRAEVEARYLFGGVPADHPVELSCDLEPADFTPRQNANYDYGVWRPEESPQRALTLGKVSGTLDTAGQATLACPGAGRAGGFSGPAQLVARAAVFEAGGGRATVGTATVPVHPERFYIGLSTGSKKVEAGNDLVVDGVTVDWQGALVRDVKEVEVSFLRLETEYGWYYDPAVGRESYRRILRPVVEARETVPVVDGKLRATWRPERDGEGFVVRAKAGDARTDLHLEGTDRWYYWAPDETQADQTPRPGRPTWLALEAPTQVGVAERFPIRFRAPYKGRVLLTAETDEVLESEWIDVEAGETVWFLELEQFVPNVYVTAFLIKDPHLEGPRAFLPDRAFGVQSVKMRPATFMHDLALTAPKETRSNQPLKVRLDLGPVKNATFATVAVVDEGILSLTGFESPNPLDAIFTQRALGVETFETIGWTLLIPPGGPSSVSGGGSLKPLDRVQPVKPVALWSGLVEVPVNGKLDLTFDVPQYRGALRVMAVTAGPRRMGHAEAEVLVRDPLVVQATLPRFLSRDDEFRVPVFVTNLSGQDRNVSVHLEAENLALAGLSTPPDGAAPVEILGPAEQSIFLADGASDTVVFKARARQATGAATLRVEARAGDLVSVEEADIPLLPAGPKSRIVKRLELEEGVLDLTPHLAGWLPLSERSTFWVTNNPYADAFDHLEHLVRYPYGCLEQTTSSTRPLLYLGSLVERVDPSLIADGGIEAMVMHGIERLRSMQTPEGGFAYWPGSSEPAYWATAYATHLLLDAQKLRFPVSQSTLDDALAWMERQVANHFPSNQTDWYSSNAEPYIHYVLALAGRPHKARIATLLERLGRGNGTGEELEHIYQLRAALYLAGDQRYERELKDPDLTPLKNERRNGWSFYSDRRRRGLVLSTMIDLFGRDPAGQRLANLVAEGLRGHRDSWYTTQELVWGITALGKYVEAGAADFEPPILEANGRAVEPQPLTAGKGGGDRVWSLPRASEYDTMLLTVPRKGEGKLYLVLASEGVRAEPDWRTGGQGLKVDRRYLDAKGQEIDLLQGELGEVVNIELTLTNRSGERIANIALVDRIPAGWEIENPRLGRGQAVDWIDSDKLWAADHLDLRDDRLEVFGHLERNESRKVVYGVRAVTAGSFAVPPVEAEAMYDPEIWAREAGEKVHIAGPWDGDEGP